MDSRERLRRLYFHEETDRPGVWVGTLYPRGDPSYDELKAYLRAHADVKVGFNGTAFETPPPTRRRVEPYSDEFERQITVLSTPAGELQCSEFLGLGGRPGVEETYYIKTREDAEKYLSLPMPQIGGDISDFFAKDREIGPRGIVEARLGSNAGSWAAGLCGPETFAMMSVTDRDILHELARREMGIILNRVKFLLRSGIGPYFAISGPELFVPPMHGPADFWDFNVRYDKPVFDLIHEAGGRIYVHCHGAIGKVLDGFLELGTDVLHPFEAPPMGDITARECKRRVRGRTTLEGNIQIARFYEGTPESIRRETLDLIADCFDDRRGLIVCPSASPYVPGAGLSSLPNFRAMIDTVLQWKP